MNKQKRIQVFNGPKGPVEVYVPPKDHFTDKFFVWLTKVSIRLDAYLNDVRQARFERAYELVQRQNESNPKVQPLFPDSTGRWYENNERKA